MYAGVQAPDVCLQVLWVPAPAHLIHASGGVRAKRQRVGEAEAPDLLG
jgi:hypothetical protein